MASGKNNRERKKRDRADREARREAKCWEPFGRALAAMRAGPKVARFLEADAGKDQLFRRMPAPPIIESDPSAASLGSLAPVEDEIRRAVGSVNTGDLARATFRDLQAGIVLRDYLKFLGAELARTVPGDDSLAEVEFAAPGHFRRTVTHSDLVDAAQSAERFVGMAARTLLENLTREVDRVAVRHSRIDHAYYWITIEWTAATANRYGGLQLRLFGAPCETAQIEVSGKARRAFRCGGAFAPDGVKWAVWDTARLGLPGPPKILPIYVQSHTLEQLDARLPLNVPEEVHDAMVMSLLQPVVVPASGPDFLVEYRLYGHRLGYLVARRLPDRVLVRSFLFLTMQGTPEAARLRDRLGLVRADIEHLGLDRPGVFLATDIAADPELAATLDACGCGYLCRWLVPSDREKLMLGYAREVRNYLGLDPPAPPTAGGGLPSPRKTSASDS